MSPYHRSHRAVSFPRIARALGVSMIAFVATTAKADAPASDLAVTIAAADEARGDYARALRDDEAEAERSPTTREGLRAAARAEVLRTHAEGDFAPFAELEQVRTDPRLSDDARTIDRLARDADHFPPGLVRVEARMLAAEAYAGRLHAPAAAIPLTRAVAGDPIADPTTRRDAAARLVDALIVTGRLDEARAAATEFAPDLGPATAKRVQRLLRRRVLNLIAIGTILAIVFAFVLAIVAGRRRGASARVTFALRRSVPLVIAFVAYVAILGGTLASLFERGTAKPFVMLAATLAPLFFLARAWAAVGSPERNARIGRAFACAAGAIAIAFVMLEWTDATYLDGFGL